LSEVDEIVLSLYARGVDDGEISAHFAQIYGANVSTETISRITDKVIEEMQAWAPPSSSEWSVNTGTVPVLALRRAASAVAGLGPSSADRVGRGRSRRSTSSPGEPVTWRRAAAVREEMEAVMPKDAPPNGGAPAGVGSMGPHRCVSEMKVKASPLGGGRPWSPVRRPVQPRARPGDAACGVRAGRGQHRGPNARRGRPDGRRRRVAASEGERGLGPRRGPPRRRHGTGDGARGLRLLPGRT